MSEEWKICPLNTNYMVSTSGQVMSLSRRYRGCIRKQDYIHEYPRVTLYKGGKKKTYKIHRLVLETFVGSRPKGYECNHKDGSKSNPNLSNLEWVTPSKNTQHSYDTGLQIPKQGEKNGRAKLTTADVLEIRRLHGAGYFYRELAERYKVNLATIGYIIARKTWKHI